MSDPVVHLTNGLPDSGTGNVTTLGQTLLDGANATHGITTGAAVITDVAGTFQQYLRGIVKLLAGTLTVASHAVTNAGTFAVQAAATLGAETTKVIGVVRLADGSGNLLTSTAGAADFNLKSGANPNGISTAALSAPVVPAGYAFHEIAASTGPTTMGTGATGDTIFGILVCPTTVSPGAITLTDNSTAYTVFAGGTSSLSNLVPFFIPMNMRSASGAWKITNGAGLISFGIGVFT